MIGIDTNVLLRVFLVDDPSQHAAARQVVTEATGTGGCLVNPLVLAEFVWTARRIYRIERGRVSAWLQRIVEAPEFIFADRGLIIAAVERSASDPDTLADHLIAELNKAAGCISTSTFDTGATAASDHFQLVPS